MSKLDYSMECRKCGKGPIRIKRGKKRMSWFSDWKRKMDSNKDYSDGFVGGWLAMGVIVGMFVLLIMFFGGIE